MTSVAPAQRAEPQMAHTPDSDAVPHSPAPVSAVALGATRPRLRDQIAENPLLSLFGVALTLFGTALVALLLFALNSINDRIDDVEARLGERMDRLEMRLGDRLDRLEAKMDAGFAAQGARIAELERKLTALIAHLNATAAVEAALEHRLLTPDGGATGSEGRPPG